MTPSCPWVLMLDESSPHAVVNAFRAGANGVFSRTQSDIRLLAKCVRLVLEGQVWIDSKQLLYLLEALTGDRDAASNGEDTMPKLTRREESVVRLVVQGMVNREIAEQLRLSEHTIKNYLFRIFDKLGVSNRGGTGALRCRATPHGRQHGGVSFYREAIMLCCARIGAHSM